MSQCGPQLIEDIKAGSFYRAQELNETLANELKKQLQPDPARALALQSHLDQATLSYATVWPHLRLLTTWTGGSCGVALDQLRKFLPEQTRIADLGYIASEFRGTMPIDIKDPGGIPLLQDNFYEFVEKNDWESGDPRFLLLDQLQDGQDYYIFITTQAGLFRYRMDDILRVAGFYKKSPLLQFIQKRKGITSITGEKLYESQVVGAIGARCSEQGIELPFFIMLADREKARYEVYLESDEVNEEFAGVLDRELAAINLEYDAKRKSGRLASVALFILKPARERHTNGI